MNSKEVFTYPALIEKIRSSGIIINDEAIVQAALTNINYQRLMVYRLHFINNGKIKPGTRFTDILDLYEFDRDIKGCIYPLLETLEFALKAKIGYYLGQKTGKHGYLDIKNFRNPLYHQGMLQNYYKAKDRDRKKRVSIVKHHEKKYIDELPIYKAIELFTFGELVRLFNNLKDFNLKREIIDEYINKENGLRLRIFRSWTIKLVDIRNICAHYDIFWSRYFELKPIRNRYWNNLSLFQIDNRHYYSIFTIMIIIKILTSNNILYDNVLNRMELIFNKYMHILKSPDIGFPTNWKKELQNH